MLKSYMEEKNIAYAEKLIDSDDLAREEMVKLSDGFMGVPFTVIELDDGKKETVVGFDRGKLNKTLGIK